MIGSIVYGSHGIFIENRHRIVCMAQQTHPGTRAIDCTRIFVAIVANSTFCVKWARIVFIPFRSVQFGSVDFG